MADGLSVAASIAGLIQIADIVVRRGYRYVRDVKDAERSIERLIDEVNKLSGVLHSLRNVAERCEDNKLDIEPTAQIHHIEACLKTLQLIDTYLETSNPARKADHVGNIKQKLIWPLNRSKVKELMSEVEKHKSVMNLAMTASTMSALLSLLDRQDYIKDNLLELKAGIERDRAKRTRVEMSKQRKLWLTSLSRVDAQRWQNANIKLRQPGSGNWFTNGPDFQEWLSIKSSKLWVHGIPGAGKTILMASAIQEAMKYTNESHALAYFYADYKVPATHDPKNMLGSLAQQIAVQNEKCFYTLRDFWGTPGSPGRMYSVAGDPTVEVLLDLITDLSTHFTDVMIIVDGLDEVAVDRSGAAYTLQSLNQPSGNVKTLFASRKEIDLEYPLRDFKELSIAAMSSDLRLYVASEIERRTRNRSLRIQDSELKEHIMRVLVDKADGMFRWVACQLDYLEECTNDRERREALNKLPPDLPSSYERILDRLNNSRNRKNQRLVVRALQWILYSEWPLNTPELLEALSVDEGDNYIDQSAITTEEDILHWASSLLRRRLGGGLEIAHFTVKEFLVAIDCQKTPHFSPYLMLQEDAEVRLARVCLTFLNCRPFSEIMPENSHDLLRIIDSHPFLPYATVNWDCHSLYHMDDEMIMLLARQLFHPTVSKQFNLLMTRILSIGQPILAWSTFATGLFRKVFLCTR
ncbi:Vegetative incompatibility HET-E-1 [Hyphodiscus hymeniophilus]|uniref:Vegetative incompatibility HET-E-1 n=1 Tax=Hyphodiscus hymeniophilus TaxID=353542 RepID=A0A9P6VIE3_9HELO|nr:Vegetative incompatibility HET-E-1 [Hyphodiscus hymeniophilus]